MSGINISIGGTVHGAVRLDKVKAAYHGNLASVVHTADLDNGAVVQLGDLVSGQRDQFNVLVPTATSINSDALYLHASPELTYYAGQTITDFFLAQGQIGRAYALETGDIFTVTDNMITGTPTAVDGWVAPVAGATTLAFTASTGTEPTTRFIGKVIEKTVIFNQAATVILVLKN